jgi:hypothetical protein
MRGVASILAQTRTADPARGVRAHDRARESARRSDDGLLVVPIRHEILIAR